MDCLLAKQAFSKDVRQLRLQVEQQFSQLPVEITFLFHIQYEAALTVFWSAESPRVVEERFNKLRALCDMITQQPRFRMAMVAARSALRGSGIVEGSVAWRKLDAKLKALRVAYWQSETSSNVDEALRIAENELLDECNGAQAQEP